MKITATPALEHTRKLYDVTFENVAVSATMCWPWATRPTRHAQRSLQVATLCAAADMLGGMQWILEDSVEYAKTRQQFGKVIGSFQAVQHMCADMLLLTESSRSAIYYAAWALGRRPGRCRSRGGIAKAYASDASREVANRGVQVHGGIGFTWEHDLQLYYKRSRPRKFCSATRATIELGSPRPCSIAKELEHGAFADHRASDDARGSAPGVRNLRNRGRQPALDPMRAKDPRQQHRAQCGHEPIAAHGELKRDIRSAQNISAHRQSLLLVAIEHVERSATSQDRGQPASQVKRLQDSGIHSLPTDGAVNIRGISGQKDPAARKPAGDAVVQPKASQPHEL